MRALALILCSAFACAPVSEAETGPETAPPPGWPREFDVFGAPLSLAAPPQRILPANAAAVDLVLALVGEERVVAVPATTFGWTESELSEEAWAERTFQRYLVESVLAFRPDLVVTHVWQNADTSNLLEAGGVPLVRIPDLASLDELLEALRLFGRLLDEEQRAADLATGLAARAAALAAAAPEVRPRALCYSNLGSGGWVAGRGTTADLLFELAGLENAATSAGFESHQAIDLETLIDLDPAYLVVGASLDADGTSPTARYLETEGALASLSALRDGRVVVLPPSLFTTASHHIVAAAEELSRRVFGER